MMELYTNERPENPYDPSWLAYWAENPHLLRGVGAGAVEPEDPPDDPVEPKDVDPKDVDPKDPVIDPKNADPEPSDWRADLPDDLRKTADRFSSKEDAIRAIEGFRKRESQVRVPGKNASDDEISAYRKAVGIPEKAEDYDFQAEGELTDEMKASQAEWSQRFHSLNIPNNVAKELAQMVNEDSEKMMAAQVEADKAFADAQDDALHQEWKGDDYEKNKTLANRAFTDIAQRAGVKLDDLTKIELKDGRFLMDRAEMSRLFAVIGREMAEGTLGPAMSDSERDTVEDQIRDVRKQIADAQSEGDSKRANKLFQKEQSLIAKMGNKPIVGAGRAA